MATPTVLREERSAAGVAVRARVPPSALTGWTAAPNRPNPVDLILGQAATPGDAGWLPGHDDAVEEAMADFAVRYADQTERDHAAFVAAIEDGRVEAVTGV